MQPIKIIVYLKILSCSKTIFRQGFALSTPTGGVTSEPQLEYVVYKLSQECKCLLVTTAYNLLSNVRPDLDPNFWTL